MYTILLIAAAGLFAWVSSRDVRIGVFLFAAALPAYLIRFDVGGVPFTFLEVMVWTLVVVSIWQGRKHWRTYVTSFNLHPRWRVPILLILLAATVAVLPAPNLPAALGIWKAYFIEPILLFLIVHQTMRDPMDRARLVKALGAGGLFVAVFGLVQAATGAGIPIPWDVEGRITSVFPYPNAVGLYLGPIVVLGVIELARKYDLFWLVTVVASLLAIFFAESEAAYVAVPATLLFASLFDRRLRRFTIPIAIVATVLVLAIPAVRTPVVQKLTLQDYSGGVRTAQWQDTIHLLQDSPLTGAGLSGYPTAIAPYHTHPEFEVFQYPHNIVLNTWVELGLLGVVAFGFLAARILYDAVALRPHDYTTLAVLFALLEMVIHGLVDVPYFKNDLACMTWILVALFALATTYDRRQTASS